VLTGSLACVPLSAEELAATAQSSSPTPLAVSSDLHSVSSSQAISIEAAVATRAATTATVLPTLSAADATAAASDTPEASAASSQTATPVATSLPQALAAAQAPSAGRTSAPATSNAEMVQQLVQLLNQYRVSQGLSALGVSAGLTRSAQSYATLLAETNYFGHIGPDGSSFTQRSAVAGYRGFALGETLNAGQTSAQASLNDWLASPSHYVILTNPQAKEVGVGFAYSAASSFGYYWVLQTGF
jgi:uncharacterized protein YkwD